MEKIEKIVIDSEYQGKESIIKGTLLQNIRKVRPYFFKDNIEFKSIGKKSGAHYAAYGVTLGKRKADIIATSKDVFKILVD